LAVKVGDLDRAKAMTRLPRTPVLLLILALIGCTGSDSGKDAGLPLDRSLIGDGDASSAAGCEHSVPRYKYLMAFHSCGAPCVGPQEHESHLAGSDDGTSWTLIEAFAGVRGSVPDIVAVGDVLYLFHTGSKDWARINSCYEVLEEGRAELQSQTDTGGYVDPSLFVGQGELVLFYLPGTIGRDPGGCAAYPCTKEIHSARATTVPTQFQQTAGARAQITLAGAGTFSDPDIVRRADGTYLLYVSMGQSVAVFTSSNLEGSYAVPGGSDRHLVVEQNAGGVPSALVVGDAVWLYVSTDKEIRRAIVPDGVTPAKANEFQTVLRADVFGSASTKALVSSPSVIHSPW
jgi:hypothetical protein